MYGGKGGERGQVIFSVLYTFVLMSGNVEELKAYRLIPLTHTSYHFKLRIRVGKKLGARERNKEVK